MRRAEARVLWKYWLPRRVVKRFEASSRVWASPHNRVIEMAETLEKARRGKQRDKNRYTNDFIMADGSNKGVMSTPPDQGKKTDPPLQLAVKD